MIKKSSLLLLIIWIAIGLSACGSDNAAVNSTIPSITISPTVIPSDPPQTPESSGAGVEALFKQSCTSCHGVDLQGDYGPNLQKVGGRLTKAQIITQITNGGDVMPSFKKSLKAEEIQALAAWLSAKK